jgi:hypothetical protein
MFKNGGFYITARGQLVRVFDTFKFADNYTINAAVYLSGMGWSAVRYTPNGDCNNGDAGFKLILTETFEKYRNYLTFTVFFDRATNSWRGKATDSRNSVIVDLNNIENPERAWQLIQMGAEQKLLTWMREAGYDEETKETVNA